MHVLPLYEKLYPNDSRVRDCIEYTKKHLQGEGDMATLKGERRAAYAAAAYAAADADAYKEMVRVFVFETLLNQ